MSQTGVVSWSQTAASNATADSNINWAEGMAPSQVNDSARAVMASGAKYRDDIAGALVSGGSNTAYTVTSNQVFSSLTVLNGQRITVRFNATNGASPTLNVDGLGAKAINVDQNTAVATGAIRANSIHELTYDNSNSIFIIHHGHSLVEPGRISMHGASTAPAGWVMCDGTGYSQSTLADLFAAISTTYGSTAAGMFSVPDLRARVAVGFDSGNATSRMGGAHLGNIGGGAGILGGTGGEENHTITQAEIASYTLVGSQTINTNQSNIIQGNQPTSSANGGGSGVFVWTGGNQPSSAVATVTVPAVTSGGSGASHNTVQPSLVVNYIIKT